MAGKHGVVVAVDLFGVLAVRLLVSLDHLVNKAFDVFLKDGIAHFLSERCTFLLLVVHII